MLSCSSSLSVPLSADISCAVTNFVFVATIFVFVITNFVFVVSSIAFVIVSFTFFSATVGVEEAWLSRWALTTMRVELTAR